LLRQAFWGPTPGGFLCVNALTGSGAGYGRGLSRFLLRPEALSQAVCLSEGKKWVTATKNLEKSL
jgi:hypothetical protein